MDIFLADQQFLPRQVIDEYQSLIWTERFSEYGNFELFVKLNSSIFFGDLRYYQYIVSPQSDRVMMIENVEIADQDTNEDMIKISGRSIEAFLENRNNKRGDAPDPEESTGTLGAIARWHVYKYCINPATAGAENVIPFLHVDDPAPSGPVVTLQVDRSDVYSIVKSICDTGNLGFRIYNSGGLKFQVYKMFDRSTTDFGAFLQLSPDDDTLTQISTLESIATYKNNARVIGNKTSVDVFTPGLDYTISGMNRRTVVVEARDIGSAAGEEDPEKSTTIAEDETKLIQRGLQTLAEQTNKYHKIITGTVPQKVLSEVNLSLGDIVLTKDKFGNQVRSLVAELVYSQDETGRKLTPGFTQLI